MEKERKCTKTTPPPQTLENNLVTLDVLNRKFRVGKIQILNLLVTGQSFKVF